MPWGDSDDDEDALPARTESKVNDKGFKTVVEYHKNSAEQTIKTTKEIFVKVVETREALAVGPRGAKLRANRFGTIFQYIQAGLRPEAPLNLKPFQPDHAQKFDMYNSLTTGNVGLSASDDPADTGDPSDVVMSDGSGAKLAMPAMSAPRRRPAPATRSSAAFASDRRPPSSARQLRKAWSRRAATCGLRGSVDRKSVV